MLKFVVCFVTVFLCLQIVYCDNEDYLTHSNDEENDEEKPKRNALPEPDDDNADTEPPGVISNNDKTIVIVEKQNRDTRFNAGVAIDKSIQELADRLFPEIECDNFAAFVLMCTVEATKIYNTSSKAPPLPIYFTNWCKAIRFMTYCATSWNQECGTKTESHFSEESLKGHIHVLKNICDDEDFVKEYDSISYCLEDSRILWEKCYSKFKKNLDELKKTKLPITHYDTHFRLCCLRASFISCTSNIYRKNLMICSKKESDIMQKFSVIIAEGDIYQKCDNTVYENCPFGDPRKTMDKYDKLKLKSNEVDSGTRKKKKRKKSKTKKNKKSKRKFVDDGELHVNTESRIMDNSSLLSNENSDANDDELTSHHTKIEPKSRKDKERLEESDNETKKKENHLGHENIDDSQHNKKRKSNNEKEHINDIKGLSMKSDKDLKQGQKEYPYSIRMQTAITKISTTAVATTVFDVTTTKEIINCDELERYARVCSAEAREFYDFKEKVPPKPPYFTEWCRSINHLIVCAVNWHVICKNNTNYYGDNSIMELPVVLDSICQDTAFSSQYSDILFCLEETRQEWEDCYSWFKASVDKEKEMQRENLHTVHFRLCCIQFSFLECTAEFYEKKNRCSKNEGLILQTVSRVIAQTDIFQVCKGGNSSCPTEIFRPSLKPLKKSKKANKAFNVRDLNNEEYEFRQLPNKSAESRTLNYSYCCLLVLNILLEFWKTFQIIIISQIVIL